MYSAQTRAARVSRAAGGVPPVVLVGERAGVEGVWQL